MNLTAPEAPGLLRADVIRHVLALTDPLASGWEVAEAFAWWDREVYAWRDARGEVTDDERWERQIAETMGEVVEQKNGAGAICVTYQLPRPRPSLLLPHDPGLKGWS